MKIFFKIKKFIVDGFTEKWFRDSCEEFLLYRQKDIEIRCFEERICCKDFLHAIEDGSDGFKCYPAIHTLDSDSGGYLIGTNDNPLGYCPWCGELL